MGGRRTPPDVSAKVLILSNRNWTSKEIAAECNITERTVTRIRSRFRSNVERNRPRSWSDEDYEFAKELLDDGASYREVAESTGIPRTTLREIFPGQGFTKEDTARLATLLPRLPEELRWSLTRNRKD